MTKIKKVNVCGIPYEVVYVEDNFDMDVHFGQIDYRKCKILVNNDLTEEETKETLAHEILHGILVHIGYKEESNDERFVQALANAIFQTFEIKGV